MKDNNMTSTGKKFTILLLLIFIIPIFSHAQEKIIFGLTGTIFKGDLKIFDEWKTYLEKKLHTPVELKFSRTYSEMINMINLGQVDVAYVCNTTYVTLQKQNSVKLLTIPATKEGEIYYSYIISKKDMAYNNLFDFKDKIFAFTDPGSNSGAIAPTYELLQNGLVPKKYFKKIIYTYKHGESIQAVLDQFVDGASVDSLVYDQFIKRYPNEARNLKVVEKLGPFPMSPIVANNNLDSRIFTNIQMIFTNMHKDQEGHNILNKLSLDKLNLPHDKDYSEIEKTMNYITTNE